MPDNKRPQIKLPTIEIPRYGDAQSMISSITQIKEAIELMSGVRGGKSYFPTYDDATLVQERLKTIEVKSQWDVIYNQEFSNINNFYINNLIEYRNLRGQMYIRQEVPAPATWPYMRYLDINGAIVAGSANYLNEARYNTEGSTAVTGWTGSANTSVIPLSLFSPLVLSSAYGCFFDFNILCLNKNIQTQFYSTLSVYDGTNIYKGTLQSRESPIAQRTGMIFAMADGTGASRMSGHLYLEGLKG